MSYAFRRIKSAVMVGLCGLAVGVALVPQLALEGAKNIRGVSIADQDLRRELGLVWRRDRHLSAAARALRNFLLDSDKG